MQKMQQTMNQQIQNTALKIITRIKKEFELCSQDSDLIQIGCSFGLVDQNNYNVWKVWMIGPQNTPYQDGILLSEYFSLLIIQIKEQNLDLSIKYNI